MKRTTLLLTLAASLLAGLPARAAAPAYYGLRVHRAVEVEIQTETNRSYQLQGSTNLTHWDDVGEPFLGHGRGISRLSSTRGSNPTNANFYYYRVRVDEGPTNGFAPWSVAGLTISFDDSPGGDLTRFLTETNGVDLGMDPDPFLYTFARTGTNSARLELNYSGAYYGVTGSNKLDLVTLTYTAAGAGTWSRDEFRNGVLKDHDTGLFRVAGPTSGGTNNPGGTNIVVTPPAPPATLSNSVYYFQNSGTPDRYVFANFTTGVEIQGIPDEGLPTNAFVYTYSVLSSNSAHLTINFGYYGAGGDRYDIDLSFTDGPAGHFVRREYRRGTLKDTDTGSFSPYLPQVTGGTNNPPLNTNAPPANPQGFTYHTSTGEHLVFQTAATGVQHDDSAPTDFSYTYAATGANAFRMRVQFKVDKWDDYDLSFTDGGHGSFVRRQFDQNVLKDTDVGTFTVSPTAP